MSIYDFSKIANEYEFEDLCLMLLQKKFDNLKIERTNLRGLEQFGADFCATIKERGEKGLKAYECKFFLTFDDRQFKQVKESFLKACKNEKQRNWKRWYLILPINISQKHKRKILELSEKNHSEIIIEIVDRDTLLSYLNSYPEIWSKVRKVKESELDKYQFADLEDLYDLNKRYISEKLSVYSYRKFVNTIPYYEYQNVDEILQPSNDSAIKNNVLKFIKNVLRKNQKNKIIMLGYYGMGKTTILNHLFDKYNKYLPSNQVPCYISLTGIPIKGELKKEIWKVISEIINLKYSRRLYGDTMRRLIEDNKVTFLIDGIDEANYDETGLFIFLQKIINLKVPMVLTSRKEFSLCLSTLKRIESDSLTTVELAPWKEEQINIFLSKFAKEKKYLEKTANFKTLIRSGIYSDLANRPLFLQMLAEIEIKGEGLPKGIIKYNKAHVYSTFIKKKISDDLKRHKGKDFYVEEGKLLKLITEIAVEEYKKFVDGRESYTGFTVDEVHNLIRKNQLYASCINENLVNKFFYESTIFSIFRNFMIGEELVTHYMFSHLSFMEYLVAKAMVEEILGKPEQENYKPDVQNTWNIYQTYEISDHFRNEVVRVFPDVSLANDRIVKAFRVALKDNFNPKNYKEYQEESLYYIGKFRLRDKELIRILKRIAVDKRTHPVYYRTVHLSLSLLGYESYIIKYVSELLANKSTCNVNTKIQKRYYGSGLVRQKLRRDIVESRDYPVRLLKIFTYFYFRQLEPDSWNLERDKKFLNEIRSKSVGSKERQVLDKIERILLKP